jgi:MFS family permease
MALTAQEEFARGWKVVLGCAIGVGCGISLQQYVGSLFVKELQAEFGWSRGQIAAAQGTLLLGVLIAPFVGKLKDTIGVRPIALFSVVMLGLLYIGFANMPGTLPIYYTLSAALIVLGSGTGAIGYSRAVVTWFDTGRGMALGLTLMGTSVVAIVAPPALTWLMQAHGWRMGYYALAGLSLLIALPGVFLFVFERSNWVKKNVGEAEGAAIKQEAKIGYTVVQALKQPRLYVLTASILFITIALVGIISQLVPLLTDKGISKGTAALLVSALAVSVLIGRIVIGLAFDKFHAPMVAFLSMGIPAVGALMLMGPSASLPLAVLAVVLIGFSQGAEVDVAAYFVAKYFGTRAYAAIYAVIGMGFAFGGIIGAVGVGALYDRFQNYDVALIAAAICFVIGSTLILFMGKYPDLSGTADKVGAPA